MSRPRYAPDTFRQLIPVAETQIIIQEKQGSRVQYSCTELIQLQEKKKKHQKQRQMPWL